jgi:arabinofuranan 3-O-arabinosyltransferase
MMHRSGPSATEFLLRPRTRYVLAWILAVAVALIELAVAWNVFASPRRKDGNSGHANIDFGGQWLMGRMLAKGLGQHLYHRNYQREVLREAYPLADEVPPELRKTEERDQHDAERMLGWLMGQDDSSAATAIAELLLPLAAHDGPTALSSTLVTQRAWTPAALERATAPQVGGALYPPIHAMLMWPLGHLRPLPAYHTFQVLGILLALLTGWGVRRLTEGRIWWPVAVTAVLVFPGFCNSLNLGQNSVVTLTILVYGWTLLARKRPLLGGAIWGLLVYKPVWAAAMFLVPLLTRRWRFGGAMLASGAGLAVATLPLVGWHSWLDWLHVGRDAALLYNVDENWIFLSRDLWSIPRRWLIPFNLPTGERDQLLATAASWALLLAVLEITTRLALLRQDQGPAVSGAPAAFVLFGAWLCCFHFMYYEILLVALPFCLLSTEPRRYLEPTFIAILPPGWLLLEQEPAGYYQPRPARTYPQGQVVVPVGPRNLCVLNNLILTVLGLLAVTEYVFPLLGIEVSASGSVFKFANPAVTQPVRFATKQDGTPWSTLCILILWLWCGWLWLRTPAHPPKDS